MSYRYPLDEPAYLTSVETTLAEHRSTGEQIGTDVRGPRRSLPDIWRGAAAQACTNALVGFEEWTESGVQCAERQRTAVREYRQVVCSARTAIDDLRAEQAWLQGASTALAEPEAAGVAERAEALDARYAAIMAQVALAAGVCASVLGSMPDSAGGLRPMFDPDGGNAAHYAAQHPPNFPDDPAQVAKYWNSLSPQLQQAYLAAYPQLLGGVDGLPAQVRHRANMVMLPSELTYWEAEIERLKKARTTADNGNVLNRWITITERDALLHQQRLAECKLHDLQRLQQITAQHPDAQLLVLDTTGEAVRAALASGNVDTADNVAVLVSGFGTRVSTDMAQSFGQTQDLKEVMDDFSRHSGQAPSAAVVTWMGYEAPLLENSFKPNQSVLVRRTAEAGAAELTPFLEGISAAKGGQVNLTLAGHSYGGLTAGMTSARTDVIDNEVLYGAPGQGEQPSQVADGRRYSMATKDDFVVNGLRWAYQHGIRGMGLPPSQDGGFGDLSVGDATGFDGRALTASHGHSEYLSRGTTAQYNLAAVASGHADLVAGS